MNSYDEKYEIRLARLEDISDIISFIDNNWRKNHILVRDKEVFFHEFVDGENVNFTLAFEKESKKIVGLMGFLYSAKDEEKRDIWGSVWKVVDGCQGMLGIEILKRMESFAKCRYSLDLGSNPRTTIPILKTLFKRFTGKMDHFYRLGTKVCDRKISAITYFPTCQCIEKRNSIKIRKVDRAEDLERLLETETCQEAIPYKDMWYMKRRYFEYPINKYDVFEILDAQTPKAAFVYRVQEYDGMKAVRIVDYIGEQLYFSYTGSFWENILDDVDIEYVDFYCLGFNKEFVENAGFTALKENDDNIIPNYFNPFVKENVDIWVYATTPNAVFCKADGDQDRPN